MATYPLHVPRHEYRGRDVGRLKRAQEFDRAAEQLEGYLNAQLERLPAGTHTFSYGTISIDAKMAKALVEKVLYGVDCGGNALTVVKK